MTLSQIRSLAAHGKKFWEIPHYLTPLEKLPEKFDESGESLAQAFESLSDQVKLLADILQAQEQTYKKLLAIEQQRSSAISRLIARLQTVEGKVNQDARFLLLYRTEFTNLRNLVLQHKQEKHTLSGFLGL